MTRAQVLNEVFSRQELEIINSHEEELRGIISKALKPSPTEKSPIASNSVEDAADTIVKLIFPENSSEKSVSIEQKAKEEILDLLYSPKYFKHCKQIAKDLSESKVSFEKLIVEETSSLQDFYTNDATRKFLLDLYNITMHFGGGNSTGKGELMFAACIADVKYASHFKSDSKVDLFVEKSKLPIEIKSDGGRLDGSGIKAVRLKTENDLPDIFSTTLRDSEFLGYGLKEFQKEVRNKVSEKTYKNLQVVVNKLYEPLPSNPFSRENISSIWFEKVPNCIDTVIVTAGEAEMNIPDAKKFLTIFFQNMYSLIYQNRILNSNEAQYIKKNCGELANICLEANDVEDFVITDTTIRARIYMSLTKDSKASKKGYLLFVKPLVDNVVTCCISYLEGADETDWKSKVKSGDLHVTPSNDDRRTAHAVTVKKR